MRWEGPITCSFCGKELINEILYDGKTVYGPWAVMCSVHFQEYGVGLGIGKGQEYKFRNEGHYNEKL